MNKIKNIDFHDKTLNAFYHDYPIQITLSEMDFYYDEDERRWRIGMCLSAIYNPFMNVIYPPKEELLDDMIADLIYEFEEDYVEVIFKHVMNSPNPEDLIYDVEFMDKVRHLMEYYIDKELDRRVDEIREIYYQVYYKTQCVA